MFRKAVILFLIVGILCTPKAGLRSWGFWAHKKINRIAVFTLPEGMIGFYKSHVELISEQAVNPDKRRYAVEGEAPRHYIDIDHYGEYPFENVPRKWRDAVEAFSEDTLMEYGIVPWHVYRAYFGLVEAFEEKNARKIIDRSADIGHYIADAHVPLHTTSNYNGQFTDQEGIHGLLESRIPELFGSDYDYFTGRADYIEDPLEFIWDAVLESHLATDTVFQMEIEATRIVGESFKYTFDDRNTQTVRTYSREFCSTYSDLMLELVERRMRAAILAVGGFWYTAWVDAGQPDINKLDLSPMTEEEKKRREALEKMYREGAIKGRMEAY